MSNIFFIIRKFIFSRINLINSFVYFRAYNAECKFKFMCFFHVLINIKNIYVYSNIVHDFVDALVMYNSIKLAAQ